MAEPLPVVAASSPPGAAWTEPTGVRTFVRVHLVALIVAAAALGAVRVSLVPSHWIDVLLLGLLAVAVCVVRAHALVDADRPVAAVVLVAASTWTIAIAATTIAPSAFNVLPLMLLLPSLLAVPYLNRDWLAALNGATVVVTGIVATLGRLSPGVGLEAMTPAWVFDTLTMVVVPMGAGLACYLAWKDHHAMTAKARDLERSRRRLVAATDGERDRIARSLREGPERQLTRAFNELRRLRTVRPANATQLLDELTAHLQAANAELRQLTHGIYPAELAEHGIEQALRAAARLCSVSTTVTATGLTRYPSEVEATVYFCCLRALQHAEAREATSAVIQLTDDGQLVFEAPAPPAAELAANADGSLYRDLADRVGAVGGILRLRLDADGSLRLHGLIPRTALYPDRTLNTDGRWGLTTLARLWFFFARQWGRAGKNDSVEPSVSTGIRALMAAAAGSLPLIAAVSAVVPDAWLLVLGASAALVWLLLRRVLRAVHRMPAQTAVTVAAAVFCSYVLVVTLLIPITASCAPTMMVIPVILAVPYLPHRRFLVAMAATIAAVTVAVVAGRLPGIGLQEQAPEWFADLAIIELAALNSTLALFFAWQNRIGMSGQTQRLNESRRRIVAASERERRRIERDLHDGAQQRLVAAAVETRVAQRLLAEQPDLADEALRALSEHLAEALAQLRELAHGIYPSMLVRGGLVEALEDAARRSPTPATVQASELRRYAPQTEQSVYFCCLEALQNATKHAGSTARVTIGLTDDDGLTFDVRDTGPGCDPATLGAGHGLTNMQDRLIAVGGTLSVHAVPGAGVHIHGHVPTADQNDPRPASHVWPTP